MLTCPAAVEEVRETGLLSAEGCDGAVGEVGAILIFQSPVPV